MLESYRFNSPVMHLQNFKRLCKGVQSCGLLGADRVHSLASHWDRLSTSHTPVAAFAAAAYRVRQHFR